MWVTKLDVVFTEPDINAVQCLQEAFTFPQDSRGMMKWDNTEDIVIVFRSLSKKQCHKWNLESCVRWFINVRACCILHKPTNCFHWNIGTLKKLKLRYYGNVKASCTNHNTTTYYVYWRTTTTINPIIIRPHCMFTDRRQQRQPNHNTTTYCVYW
jgi:hypothetical protein